MTETILTIEGMMCGMCESHVAQALRSIPGVRKVKADRKRQQAVVISKSPVSEQVFLETLKPTGYELKGCISGPLEKKLLFGLGSRK